MKVCEIVCSGLIISEAKGVNAYKSLLWMSLVLVLCHLALYSRGFQQMEVCWEAVFLMMVDVAPVHAVSLLSMTHMVVECGGHPP